MKDAQTGSIMKNALPEYIDTENLNSEEKKISDTEKKILGLINDKVAAGQSLDDIMSFLFEKGQGLFPCDRISLAFLEEENKRAVSYISKTSYEPVYLKKGFHQDLKDSSLARLIEKGCPRLINDLESYTEAKGAKSPSSVLLLKEGISSSMSCPLFVEKRIVGLLFLSSKEKFAYSGHHVFLYLNIAERISQAVEKAYIIEKLREANEAYTGMLSFVAHELKSPLSSVIMGGTLLTEGYMGELRAQQKEQIEKIISKSAYLMQLVEDYLNLARIEENNLECRIRADCDFTGEVIDEAISMSENLIRNKNIKLEKNIPDKLEADCDPGLMKIVMTNLISNAVKYADEKAVVKISASKNKNNLAVSVWNEGPGFPENEKSKLFKKFSRLEKTELKKRKGTGVGLYTVWRIIQLHKGKTSADSEEGKWAEFKFEIPTRNRETP